MQTITLGDVEITRITEWEGASGTVSDLLPDGSREEWEANRSWMAPEFWNPDTDDYMACIQTWVLRSEGRTILVDTGNGNDKERPGIPIFGHLKTDFLIDLAKAGVQPEDVDVVVNTHVHVDHVGWNTRLENGEWVPTFPNATYLISKPDFEFWNPENNFTRRGEAINQNMFVDSVAPVHRAGMATLWDGSHRIDGNLRLDLAPGHTPGLAVLTLESRGDRAVFVGDMLHSPMQVQHPDWNSCFCEDPVMARASRRRTLEWAADNNALVVPAHLRGDHAFEVARNAGAFAIKGWAFYRES